MNLHEERERQQLATAYDIARQWGFMSLAEVGVLQEYALKLPPNARIVNVGAGGGTSGLAFLSAREDLQVTTVDINAEGYGSLRGETNALRVAGLGDSERHKQILGDSSSIGREWPGGLVDLVFIDADHSVEGATKDFEAWAQHVKVGGYLLAHDVDNEPMWPGVRQAVDATIAKWGNWKFIEKIRTVGVWWRSG